jgi:hypothetical protein
VLARAHGPRSSAWFRVALESPFREGATVRGRITYPATSTRRWGRRRAWSPSAFSYRWLLRGGQDDGLLARARRRGVPARGRAGGTRSPSSIRFDGCRRRRDEASHERGGWASRWATSSACRGYLPGGLAGARRVAALGTRRGCRSSRGSARRAAVDRRPERRRARHAAGHHEAPPRARVGGARARRSARGRPAASLGHPVAPASARRGSTSIASRRSGTARSPG